MAKRLSLIIFEVLFFALCVWTVLQSADVFLLATNRAKTMIDFQNVQAFFETSSFEQSEIYLREISDTFLRLFEDIFGIDSTFFEKISHIFEKILNLILDFTIYFCNYFLTVLMILFIIFHEIFTKEVELVRYSKGAKLYWKWQRFETNLRQKILSWITKLGQLLKKKKRFLLLHILIYLLAKGYLYLALIEFLIFLEVYIIRLIHLETYLLVFHLLSYIFTLIYPLIKVLPKEIIVLFLIIFIFFRALSKAKYRLRKNHERLKKFAKEYLTQTTFINGPPGTGKTHLNMSLALVSEENYIEELEEFMLDEEIKNPSVNFAEVRFNQNSKYPEYKALYEIERSRASYLISNYAIYSPYFMTYSKIFNFDYMRKNLKTDKYPLEEYIVISLSELDKEYNSHDDMKIVGTDGAATFFSTISHDLKRHCKIFCDYQLKDQVPLRIRGNAEYFLTIEKRKKKYPFLLYLYYLPFLGLRKLLRSFIKKYETKRKPIQKNTTRQSVSTFKRNDYTFLFALLRRWNYLLEKVCKFFDQYWYFKMSSTLGIKDGEQSDKKTLHLKLCDLEIDGHRLYDSTFLSHAYQEKKNYAFKDLPCFTSLTPSGEELDQCHSRFYDKLNGRSSPFISTDDETEII